MPVGVYWFLSGEACTRGTLFEHLSIAPHQMYHGCSHLFVSLKGQSIVTCNCYRALCTASWFAACLRMWNFRIYILVPNPTFLAKLSRVRGLFLFRCGNLVCTLGNTQTLAGVIAFRLHCYQQSSNSRNEEMKNNIKITNSKQLTNCWSGLLISSGSLTWCSLQISGMRLNGPWMEWLCKT